jgi:molybdopterin molybdotransferase
VLVSLLRALGCEVTDLGIVPDSLPDTRAALREAAQRCDLVVTSGGMSVGEEDHVRPAVQAEGELHQWQIAIKPGKPLAYGRLRRATDGHAHFIGLPGNPVSSFVTFLLAVAPVLRVMQGREPGGATDPAAGLRLPAHFDWLRPDRRREFLRARLDVDGGVEIFPNQSSGVLTSTAWAQGLVDVPAGQAVRRGEVVRFLALRDLMA